MGWRVLCVILLGGFLAACATGPDPRYAREGVAYGVTEGVFRGRWWSYYERGVSFQAGEFHEEAAADFRKALAGRSRDTWRARTYGLHFVNYFPNRELGVTFYHLGYLEEAAAYLSKSLAQIDTDRAHYYLDLVKKAQIAQGGLLDEVQPTLAARFSTVALIETPRDAEAAHDAGLSQLRLKDVRLLQRATAGDVYAEQGVMLAKAPHGVRNAAQFSVAPLIAAQRDTQPSRLPAPSANAAPQPNDPLPPGATVLAERHVRVQVAAGDDIGVSRVRLDDETLPQRGSAEDVHLEREIVLEEGTHEVKVAATDLAGKSTIERTEITVDLTGPTIGIFEPIEPTITEDGMVLLEGATVDRNGVTLVTLGSRALAESEGEPRLSFAADLPLANGENTFVLAAQDVAGNETRSAIKVFKGDPDSIEAKLWLLEQKYPERLRWALSGAIPLDALLAAPRDPAGEIRLKSPAPDRPYRHNRSLRVSGDVVTTNGVASITINGEPFEDLTGAPKESFNRRLPLDVDGEHDVEVVVQAQDTAGAALEKRVSVQVRPVTLAARESRMPVAVLAFAGQDKGTEQTDALRRSTEAQLFSQGRFRMLDSTRLRETLTEQQLASALASPDEALRLGPLTATHVFLTGDVIPHDQNGVEVKVRVINTATGDLAATLDVFIDDLSQPESVQAACDHLATQLARVFPRISGEVLDVRGSALSLDWNREDGVREGAYLLVVQEEDAWIDDDTGEILAPGEFVEVGRARITSVSKDSTRAVTETREEEIRLEKGMPAITM